MRKINIATGASTQLGDPDYSLKGLTGIYVDALGSVYVLSQHRLGVIPWSNQYITNVIFGTLVPGSQDGPFATAELYDPEGLAVNEQSQLVYITEFDSNSVRLVDLNAEMVSVLAVLPDYVVGITLDTSASNLYVSCPFRNSIYRIDLLNNNLISLFAGHNDANSKFNSSFDLILLLLNVDGLLDY